MGLSIKNEAVEAKVRRLAALTGLGVTEAIDLAVSEKLAREGRVSAEEQARRIAAVRAVLDSIGPLPPLDQKAIDDEVYDEHGLER